MIDFEQFYEILHQKQSEGYSPKLWVLGDNIISRMKYEMRINGMLTQKQAEEDDNLTLLGVPYVIDNENRERIDLIV